MGGLLLLVTGVCAQGAGPEGTQAPSSATFEVVGITLPYREATLSVVQPGRIEQIAASEGSVVAEGSPVFALKDGVQRARTELARGTSESTLEVELAKAHLERAERDLERLRRLHGNDDASSKELADAHSVARIARLECELARFVHGQAALAYQREKELLDQFHIRAPFHGYVAEHLKHPGEAVEEGEGVIRLVQVDPLQVVTDCPLALAGSVKAGEQVRVRPVEGQWPARWGTVILASRVADGASQTFKVKLTVPNEDAAWMAGLKVLVEFPNRQASTVGVPSLTDKLGRTTDRVSAGAKTVPAGKR